jgi:aspartate/methionine/tyrosine aminotransferase
LSAIINDGDEVILPAPYWVSYDEMVKLVGGTSVFIQTSIDTEFKITAEQLEKAITPKTKALLYSSPCNPSGSFYTKEELSQLLMLLQNILRLQSFPMKSMNLLIMKANTFLLRAFLRFMSKPL